MAGSVEEARKSLTDRRSRLLQEIYDAEAQLAENRSTLGDANAVPARLERKIEVFSNQLARVHGDIALLDKNETSILEVQRKLRQDRESYEHIAAGIEAAKFDDAIRDVKTSNIQTVQTPSPPVSNVSQRLKVTGGTFFGFLAAGLALALVIELLTLIGTCFRDVGAVEYPDGADPVAVCPERPATLESRRRHVFRVAGCRPYSRLHHRVTDPDTTDRNLLFFGLAPAGFAFAVVIEFLKEFAFDALRFSPGMFAQSSTERRRMRGSRHDAFVLTSSRALRRPRS